MKINNLRPIPDRLEPLSLEETELMTETRSPGQEWQPVSVTAPEGDLELGIVDYDGLIVALPYPCHRTGMDFVDAANRRRVDIQPTHWRSWSRPH